MHGVSCRDNGSTGAHSPDTLYEVDANSVVAQTPETALSSSLCLVSLAVAEHQDDIPFGSYFNSWSFGPVRSLLVV